MACGEAADKKGSCRKPTSPRTCQGDGLTSRLANQEAVGGAIFQEEAQPTGNPVAEAAAKKKIEDGLPHAMRTADASSGDDVERR